MNRNSLITFLGGLLLGAILMFALTKLTHVEQTVDQASEPCPKVEPVVCQEEVPEEVVVIEEELPEIDPAALLPPPMFAENAPETFETVPPGEFRLDWQEVRGADRYRVYISYQGEVIYETSKKGTPRLYVKNIPFVDREAPFLIYDVQLASQNLMGEYGKKGKIRKLKIWKNHGFERKAKAAELLKAPVIKSIKIED